MADNSSEESRQTDEIIALKSIYDTDFLEPPPPKAWKAASRLHEFIIKVPHPDIKDAHRVFLHLHTKFPKTYPTLACPIFTVQKPIAGLTEQHISRLNSAIRTEAANNKGSEMVFQIITFIQEWLEANIVPPSSSDNIGSLATQMQQRTLDAAQAKREREAAAMQQEQARAAEAAAQLQTQIRQAEEELKAGEEKRQRERDEEESADGSFTLRRRAESDATAVPPPGALDTPTETFSHKIEFRGLTFNTVKIFHPRKDGLGTKFSAEPVCDDMSATVPLDLFAISFDSPYYSSNQGRKKLKQVEAELRDLIKVRHKNLLSILAVSLTFHRPNGEHFPRLAILSEQSPPLTLHGLLEDCESIREERATDYLRQILSALNVVHAANIIHRGINARCIYIASQETVIKPPMGLGFSINSRSNGSLFGHANYSGGYHSASGGGTSVTKIVKLGHVGYYVRLLDLHRSNAFGPDIIPGADEWRIPESWLSKEIADSPLVYNRARDIHAVGIVLLQMVIGLDVTTLFMDFYSALKSSSISTELQHRALSMLSPSKRTQVSCMSLLSDCAETAQLAQFTPGSSPQFTFSLKTPMPHRQIASSPEPDYFTTPARTRQASRWKEDWEELELLGKGGFGSVVKAKNKIDGRIYAVKKVKLRTTPGDSKIFREVNALSRLSHRFIVRYYTTWVETSEVPVSTSASRNGSNSASSATSDDEDGMTSVPQSNSHSFDFDGIERGISIDLKDLDSLAGGGSSKSSFPSIHFARSLSGSRIIGSGSEESDESEGSSSDDAGQGGDDIVFEIEDAGPAPGNDPGSVIVSTARNLLEAPRPLHRTLYIQMEFVEKQTLKERIDEGLTEGEAWRLFQQIVDALVHMANLGILHRDIKLTNIFIDGKGDCKVGDFGLATSSLAAVDPSDVSPQVTLMEADMTLEVGTKLYIAPEVQSRRRGVRNHAKADLYSLGIVFFEMNHPFTTGFERIKVIEDLRRPEIFFPVTWDARRMNQRKIITWLLQHDPVKRPTALELSQSSLMPQRLEDEYLKGALTLIAKQDSHHRETVLSSFFSQESGATRPFVYYHEAQQREHEALNDIVEQKLAAIFRLHGAVYKEPPLLVPSMGPDDQIDSAVLLDRQGEVVMLPNTALVPFAQLAAQDGSTRIKRYHISNCYRPIARSHPRTFKMAVFDMITPDLEAGPFAAVAELITIVNEFLNTFPGLDQSYEIHISHSKFAEAVLARIPNGMKNSILDILEQTKSSVPQKRALLLKKGLLRSTVDELEALMETDADVDAVMAKLERMSPNLANSLTRAVEDVRMTIHYTQFSGSVRTIYFRPLMLGNHHDHFTNGVRFEVVRGKKRNDILASAGRYDDLINRWSPPKTTADAICAFALQLDFEKITMAMAAYQSRSVGALIKEQRSFGLWSPRRCDVYVVSYQPGLMQERLEIAALLWQNNISADIMYESGLTDSDSESHVDVCAREGILFLVYLRSRLPRQTAIKVKNVLRGLESELTRQELVPWLQYQLGEQKRVDLATSTIGSVGFSEAMTNILPVKDSTGAADALIQLILPGDAKKQRKQTKQIFFDKVFEATKRVKTSLSNGMPTIAVDIPFTVFDAMTRNSSWVADDEAWRQIANVVPAQHSSYAYQIREAIIKRKDEGHRFVLLFAVREEKVHLLAL